MWLRWYRIRYRLRRFWRPQPRHEMAAELRDLIEKVEHG